jgi:hypothetical protein
MRDLKPGCRDAPAAVEKKVEIQRAGPILRSARLSTRGDFGFSEKGEEGVRGKRGRSDDDGVEKIRLRRTANGRRTIDGGHLRIS